MGDINLDLSRENRFKKMAYGLGVAGAIAGGLGGFALGIATAPLAIAGAAAIGAVAGGIVVPTAVAAVVGLAYAVVKAKITGLAQFTPTNRRTAKFRKQSVIGRAYGKGFKSLKEDLGMTMLLAGVIGVSSAKAFFVAPIQAVASVFTPKDKKAGNDNTAAPSAAKETKTPDNGTLKKEADNAFSSTPAADKKQAPKQAAKNTKKKTPKA